MSEEKAAKPDWVKTKPAEVEKLVLDLHKEGKTPARIGLILRDQHGIPKAKLLGKSITKILKAHKEIVTPEKVFVQKKMDNLNRHITAHKHDYTAKRSLSKKLWVMHRLAPAQ